MMEPKLMSSEDSMYDSENKKFHMLMQSILSKTNKSNSIRDDEI